MTTEIKAKQRTAKIAGWLYLVLAITGGFGIMYVPSSILVMGDAEATANNIINSKLGFSLSIISNLVSQVIFVFLVLALSRLFKGINQKYNKLMVALVIVSVPITFINMLNLMGAQMLVSGADYLNVFETNQLNALAVFFIELYKNGIVIVEIFWGLWLFPFGYLVYKSGFIPKILGAFLILGCFSYMTESLVGLLNPELKEIISPFLMMPLALGEISMVLWLVIKSVKIIKE